MSRPQFLEPTDVQPKEPRQQADVTRRAPELLTQGEVCRMFGISDETWRRWVKAGRTPQRVDLPGHPRWRREDIEALKGQPAARRYFRSVAAHGRKSAATNGGRQW
jgi:predicted DNA-binding transcriptional regulator AlpA